jgi:hypothetical protein
MVFTSSTLCRTLSCSTPSFAPSQSTSCHFSPKAFIDAKPEANTYQSNRALKVTQLRPSAGKMLAVLKSWRQQTQFAADSDWMFASPAKLGRLPVSYPHVWKSFQQAASTADIGKLSTHTMRHYSEFRTIPGETGIRSAIDVMT